MSHPLANPLLALGLGAWLLAGPAIAEEPRRIEQNGIVYHEYRTVVRRPVSTIEYDKRAEVVYRETFQTERRLVPHTTYVPVTSYRWELVRASGWNPWAAPEWKQVPYTAWQARTQMVEANVPVRQVIPETRTVALPRRELAFVDDVVVTRVVVSQPAASAAAGTVAQRPAPPVPAAGSPPATATPSGGWPWR